MTTQESHEAPCLRNLINKDVTVALTIFTPLGQPCGG